jgi:hypothetical protein
MKNPDACASQAGKCRVGQDINEPFAAGFAGALQEIKSDRATSRPYVDAKAENSASIGRIILRRLLLKQR